MTFLLRYGLDEQRFPMPPQATWARGVASSVTSSLSGQSFTTSAVFNNLGFPGRYGFKDSSSLSIHQIFLEEESNYNR